MAYSFPKKKALCPQIKNTRDQGTWGKNYRQIETATFSQGFILEAEKNDGPVKTRVYQSFLAYGPAAQSGRIPRRPSRVQAEQAAQWPLTAGFPKYSYGIAED
jgi:hypothetical protein